MKITRRQLRQLIEEEVDFDLARLPEETLDQDMTTLREEEESVRYADRVSPWKEIRQAIPEEDKQSVMKVMNWIADNDPTPTKTWKTAIEAGKIYNMYGLEKIYDEGKPAAWRTLGVAFKDAADDIEKTQEYWKDGVVKGLRRAGNEMIIKADADADAVNETKMKITRRQLRQIIKEEISRITEAASQCGVSEMEFLVLFDRGKSQIMSPPMLPNELSDLICMITAGMESDRNFIRIKTGTSGTGSDQANQKVMMNRIVAAQDEVANYLTGIAGPTGLQYAWPAIWNKADYDLKFDTIKPGSVLKGTQVPSDPDDPWFRDKQYVRITISAASLTPATMNLAKRFLDATVERGLSGVFNPTDDSEVYAILKELRDAKDFYQFNLDLRTLSRQSDGSSLDFYQIACSRNWDKVPLTLGAWQKKSALAGGPTEIEEDDPTVDAELRRLGVPQLKC